MNTQLIIYDIHNPKRLQRIAKLMLKYGIRVQKSVFEMICSDAAIASLRREALTIMSDDDSLIIFNLCPRCWHKKRQIGVSAEGVNEDENFIIL